jgi:hypothetical protein
VSPSTAACKTTGILAFYVGAAIVAAGIVVIETIGAIRSWRCRS